jgi:hypothetical protein
MAMHTQITGQAVDFIDADAGDDVGAVAGGGGLRHVLHRLVLRAGVVLGDPHQRAGQHQADHAGAEQRPAPVPPRALSGMMAR